MDDQHPAPPADERGQDEKLSLSRRALLILVLPLVVFFLSNQLISTYGMPVDQMPPRLAFNADAEATGRLRALGTFLLLVGVVAATLAHFVLSLARLNWASKRDALVLYALVAGVGAPMLVVGPHRETQEFVGQRLVCAALSLPAPPVLRPAEGGGRPPDLANPADCRAPGYLTLRGLIEFERLLLLLAIPAVVLGAVTCLARCSDALPAERKREFRRAQIEHLNMVLYLAALLLVIGLLFVGAFLQWPGYALEGAALAAYRSHAGAIVLFHGATYSVLLASYYVPTVLLLSREPALPGPCAADEDGQPSPVSPLALVRVGGAMFAPFIVSILGEVANLPI